MTEHAYSLFDVLRANEGLVAALALGFGMVLVLTILGLMMAGAGVSLRPVVFFVVLMGPLVAVFLAAQLVQARVPQAAFGGGGGLAVKDGKFADRQSVFGPGIAMVRDARGGLPGILDEAEVAEAAVTLSGETVLAAQFPGRDQARRASAAYHEGFGFRDTSGSETKGWRATRMQGDHVEMLLAGRNLFVWTGLTAEAAAARRAASKLPETVTPPAAAPLIPALQPLERLFSSKLMQFAGLIFMVAIYSIWFFKGSSWASSSRPAPGTPALPVEELSRRLLAVDDVPVAFTVSPGRTSREFFADWRYADAAWVDLARARKLRKVFRIRMILNESSHTVRTTDYTSEFDMSAGFDGASLAWKASMGIVFFQRQQETVFGLQLDGEGRSKAALSYSYKFDLNEMKVPIRAVVTGAGWTWRPTVLPGPTWLQWLIG